MYWLLVWDYRHPFASLKAVFTARGSELPIAEATSMSVAGPLRPVCGAQGNSEARARTGSRRVKLKLALLTRT